MTTTVAIIIGILIIVVAAVAVHEALANDRLHRELEALRRAVDLRGLPPLSAMAVADIIDTLTVYTDGQLKSVVVTHEQMSGIKADPQILRYINYRPGTEGPKINGVGIVVMRGRG